MNRRRSLGPLFFFLIHPSAFILHPFEEFVANLQAQGARDATAGMAGHEQVVEALVWVGVAHQAALGANRLEAIVAARDELVRINLMPGVPDETVVCEVEGQMQSQA